MRRGVYPGSLNPPTVAHLAVAEAACRQAGLDVVVLSISAVALGKVHDDLPDAEARRAALTALAHARPWLDVQVTSQQLVADIAAGYDALVVGADKWAQVVDPAWYGGSEAARDRAVAGLPPAWVAPRPPWPTPPPDPPRVHVLLVDEALGDVSATAVRRGRHEWRARP